MGGHGGHRRESFGSDSGNRMIRILADLLLFFLPFVLYFGWVKFVRRQMEASGGTWQDAPLGWLVAAGVVLVGLSLAATALMTGGDPSKTYYPPRYEDGRIVPSQIR
jgi:Family of unknown function (DUF6111)